LSQGVHTGIRASGAVDSDMFATNFFKRALDFVLDRVVMSLTLPTAKRRAIIGND